MGVFLVLRSALAPSRLSAHGLKKMVHAFVSFPEYSVALTEIVQSIT